MVDTEPGTSAANATVVVISGREYAPVGTARRASVKVLDRCGVNIRGAEAGAGNWGTPTFVAKKAKISSGPL